MLGNLGVAEAYLFELGCKILDERLKHCPLELTFLTAKGNMCHFLSLIQQDNKLGVWSIFVLSVEKHVDEPAVLLHAQNLLLELILYHRARNVALEVEEELGDGFDSSPV